jgi:enoyl-CoA hydratase
MTYNTILFSVDNNIAIITLNRPRSFNVLDTRALHELRDCFYEEIYGNDSVNAVIITGEGEKAFCGGADIKEMKDMEAAEALALAQFGQRTMAIIEDCPKPVIAAINGVALGGGFELALSCDFILAAKKARFASPEVNVGIMVGWGASYKLVQILGKNRAKLLLFTGEMIDSDTAFQLGLINQIVPDEKLMDEALDLAGSLAEKPSVALTMVKRVVNRCGTLDRETAGLLEAEAFGACFSTKDQKEGMNAFVEKRKPIFTGK